MSVEQIITGQEIITFSNSTKFHCAKLQFLYQMLIIQCHRSLLVTCWVDLLCDNLINIEKVGYDRDFCLPFSKLHNLNMLYISSKSFSVYETLLFPIYSCRFLVTYSNFIEEEDGKTHCVNCTKDTELYLTARTDASSTNDSTTYCKFVIHYQTCIIMLTNKFCMIVTSIPSYIYSLIRICELLWIKI